MIQRQKHPAGSSDLVETKNEADAALRCDSKHTSVVIVLDQ